MLKRLSAFVVGCVLFACAQIVSAGTAELSWNAPAVPVDSYSVYKRTATGSYSKIATVPAPATAYTCPVTDPLVDTTYFFVITAHKDGLESGFSNEVSKLFAGVLVYFKSFVDAGNVKWGLVGSVVPYRVFKDDVELPGVYALDMRLRNGAVDVLGSDQNGIGDGTWWTYNGTSWVPVVPPMPPSNLTIQ